MNDAFVSTRLAALTKHPLVRRVVTSFMSRLLGAVANVAFVVYLGRYLGAEQTGLYMIGLGAATLLSTVGRLGLEQIAIREGGPLVRDGQWAALHVLYRRSMTLSMCASTAIAVLLALLAYPLAHYVFHKDGLAVVLPWFAASILPLSYAFMHVPFLQVVLRPERSIALLSLWIPLVSLPLLLLIDPRSAAQGAALYLAACMINAAIACIQWRRCSHAGAARQERPSGVTRVPLLRPAIPLLIGNIGQIALLWIAVFAVGIVASSVEVGAYSVAQRVALTLSGFLLPPIDAMVGPRIAVMRGVSTREQIGELVRSISSVLFPLAALLFGFIVLFGHEILNVFGGQFGDGYWALVCLTFGQLVIVASGSIRPVLVVHGQEKQIRNAMVCAAIACAALCAVLLPMIGPIGAAIATSVSLAGEKLVEGIVANRKLGIATHPSYRFYALQLRTWSQRRNRQS